MDGAPLIRKTRRYVASSLVIACVLGACVGARSRPDAARDTSLTQAFEVVGRVPLYLEFPARPDILGSCERRRDAACLDVYRDVRRAVGLIFRGGRVAALERTLGAIRRECGHPDIPLACRGAVLSLYFFQSDREDQIIVAALQKAEPAVLRAVFAKDYLAHWAGFRPDLARWRAAIETAALDEAGKREILDSLDGELRSSSRTADGGRWERPAIHMVDPSYVASRR